MTTGSSAMNPQQAESGYIYEKLPTPSYTRILVLGHAQEPINTVICEMKLVDLEQSPMYDALSYSWGMNADGDTSKSKVIWINGKLMPVTQNLFQGLVRLRAANARNLWVDAVCINQMNIPERNAQVANMAMIYSKAQKVIAWLGEPLDIAQVTFIKEMLMSAGNDGPSFPEGWRQWDRVTPRAEFRAWTWTMKSFESIPRLQAFQHLTTFFNIRYLRRRWVIQELFNGQSIILHWGAELFTWEQLCALKEFSADCRRYGKEAEELSFRANMLDGVLGNREKYELPNILTRCYTWQCSDARDMVYALASLDHDFGIVVDYNRTIAETFIHYAERAILSGQGEVVFTSLSQPLNDSWENPFINPLNERQPRRRMQGLPSWVPDLHFQVHMQSVLEPAEAFDEVEPQVLNHRFLEYSPYGAGTIKAIRKPDNERLSYYDECQLDLEQSSFQKSYGVTSFAARRDTFDNLDIRIGDIACFLEVRKKYTLGHNRVLACGFHTLRPIAGDPDTFTMCMVTGRTSELWFFRDELPPFERVRLKVA